MTTPERRRWLPQIKWQAWGLMVLGLAVGLVAIYFQHLGNAQQQCFHNYATNNAEVLNKRADLAKQDSSANEAESAATRQLIIDAFASKSRQDAFAAFRKAQHGWAVVDKERARVARQRAANPIPAFPAGTCN